MSYYPFGPAAAFEENLCKSITQFNKNWGYGGISTSARYEQLGVSEYSATFVAQFPVPGAKSDEIYAEIIMQERVRFLKQNNSSVAFLSVPFDPKFVTFAGFTVNEGILAVVFKYNVPSELRTQTIFAISEADFQSEITK
ncbi:hypothetical protein AAY80_052 [Stenotrophomonas phage vB_SmaS-DLP_6]|nr:hypothetical protein AAY80_052 [Stenotrophomonas phage vB_SmaS-DLP_6]